LCQCSLNQEGGKRGELSTASLEFRNGRGGTIGPVERGTIGGETSSFRLGRTPTGHRPKPVMNRGWKEQEIPNAGKNSRRGPFGIQSVKKLNDCTNRNRRTRRGRRKPESPAKTYRCCFNLKEWASHLVPEGKRKSVESGKREKDRRQRSRKARGGLSSKGVSGGKKWKKTKFQPFSRRENGKHMIRGTKETSSPGDEKFAPGTGL